MSSAFIKSVSFGSPGGGPPVSVGTPDVSSATSAVATAAGGVLSGQTGYAIMVVGGFLVVALIIWLLYKYVWSAPADGSQPEAAAPPPAGQDDD